MIHQCSTDDRETGSRQVKKRKSLYFSSHQHLLLHVHHTTPTRLIVSARIALDGLMRNQTGIAKENFAIDQIAGQAKEKGGICA